MTLPTPWDPAHRPIWEDYLVAEAVNAALGLIPTHAFAIGVTWTNDCAVLHFRMSECSESDLEDMDDMDTELWVALGGQTDTAFEHQLKQRPESPDEDGVRWFYVARSDDLSS